FLFCHDADSETQQHAYIPSAAFHCRALPQRLPFGPDPWQEHIHTSLRARSRNRPTIPGGVFLPSPPSHIEKRGNVRLEIQEAHSPGHTRRKSLRRVSF